MKVFLTGGGGFVGRHLISELQSRGHEVLALVRKAGTLRNVQELIGDITQPEVLSRAELSNCHAVIHLVGIIREFPSRGITFENVHVQGTQNLLEVCRKAGIRRYLHMSALGASSESRAHYQRSKAEAEDLVRASGLDWTIFRPAVILGSDGEFTNLAAGMTRRRIVPLMGDGSSPMSFVAVSTVAQAFVNALERDETMGREYDIVGDIMPYRRFMEIFAAKMGVKVLMINSPLGLLKVMATLLDRFPAFPLTREQIIMLEENQPRENRSVYAELGVDYKNLNQILNEALG